MSANDKQIGGDHYSKDGEQHWDRMYRLYGRGYFVGCATKYIERYHLKNGRQDLEKAIHFIQKLIELEYTPVDNYREQLALKISNTRSEIIRKQDVEIKKQLENADIPSGPLINNYVSPMLANFWGGEEPQSQGYVNQDGSDV